MLKKRLIFTLLAQKGRFMLSRNFTLQAAGDLDWIMEHYEFDSIAFSVDELIVLNVDRETSGVEQFCNILAKISAHCFMPIAAGGRIRCIEDADRLFKSGADKIVVNSSLFLNHALVRGLVARFGSQSVIASIDYKRAHGGEGEVFTEDGSRPVGMTLSEAIFHALDLGAGELYLTSITRDGTGQGLDSEYISRIGESVAVPVIISGGAGNFRHLSDAISLKSISAVSTANLFNFMSDNLTEARQEIIASGTSLATWEKVTKNTDHE